MTNSIATDVEFSLFENGLDFIQSSIAHLTRNETKSDVKYGLLHLASGAELIFKFRLSLHDWKQLFDRIDMAEEMKYENGDFKSVNFDECLKRLRRQCNVDFEPHEKILLKEMRNKRNKVEHFSISDSSEALNAYLNQILNLILDFIDEHIPAEDRAIEEELLDDIRASLNRIEEFVELRRKAIQPLLDSRSNYNFLACPNCFEEALEVSEEDVRCKCLFCGFEKPGEEMARLYIENSLNISEYLTVKDGGEYPLYECTQCNNKSFVRDEENDLVNCFSCGWQDGLESLSFCSSCGDAYQTQHEDYEIDLCSSCIAHKMGAWD